jgi:hypothetical protein
MTMKMTSLAVVALVGFVLAGCGSGAKPAARYTTGLETTQGSSTLTLTAPTTLTVASVQTGASVRCTNHGVSAGAKVPQPGHGVSGSADGKSSSATLSLTRRGDGSLAISCAP